MSVARLSRDYTFDGRPFGAKTTCIPKVRYGHGQSSKQTYYHRVNYLSVRWRGGRVDGASALWVCGARSTRPTLVAEPPKTMHPCPHCFEVKPRGAA